MPNCEKRATRSGDTIDIEPTFIRVLNNIRVTFLPGRDNCKFINVRKAFVA